MHLKITIWLLLVWIASCNARVFSYRATQDEKKDAAEELPGSAESEEEYEYEDVMDGLTELPPEHADADGKDQKDNKSPTSRDFSLHHLRQISAYIDKIKRAMEKTFRPTAEGAHEVNGGYINETKAILTQSDAVDEDDGSNKSIPEEGPKADGKDQNENKSPTSRDFSLHHLRQISAYIDKIKRAMEKTFRPTAEGAHEVNGTYINETIAILTQSDEVDKAGDYSDELDKSIPEEGPKADGKDQNDNKSPTSRDFSLHHLRQISVYIDKIKRAMEKTFRPTAEGVHEVNGTYINETIAISTESDAVDKDGGSNKSIPEEGPKAEGTDQKDNKSPTSRDISLHHLRQISGYIDKIKRAMEKTFRPTAEGAKEVNGAHVNETIAILTQSCIDAVDKDGGSDQWIPEEGPRADGKDQKDSKYPTSRDISLHHLRQISACIDKIIRAMEKTSRPTAEGAHEVNGTYINETDDEIEVKGHKYHVHKSIIQASDNGSTVLVEAIESAAEKEREKRSNWFAEEADNAKSSDP